MAQKNVWGKACTEVEWLGPKDRGLPWPARFCFASLSSDIHPNDLAPNPNPGAREALSSQTIVGVSPSEKLILLKSRNPSTASSLAEFAGCGCSQAAWAVGARCGIRVAFVWNIRGGMAD